MRATSICLVALQLMFLSCGSSIYTVLFTKPKELARSIPESWKDAPVIILDDSVIIDVQRKNDSNRIEKREITYFLINRTDNSDLKTITLSEFPDIERRIQIKAAVLYSDNSWWIMPASSIVRTPAFSDEYFASDDTFATITVPRYTKGTIIRLEYVRTFIRPEYFSSEYLRDKYPQLHKSICLKMPGRCDFIWLFSNKERLTVDTATAATFGGTAFTINASSLNKISDRDMKTPEEWYAGIHFSIPLQGKQSSTWKELGDSYFSEHKDAYTSDTMIRRIADSLNTTGLTVDSIVRLTAGMLHKRIRYHADFSGAHGFNPWPASQVLRSGLGDCKGMTALLVTLLRQQKIDANPALISTENEFQVTPAVPSLSSFNHVITWYRASGKIHFIDLTMQSTQPVFSSFFLLGQKVFLLEKNASHIDSVKDDQVFRNLIITESEVHHTNGWTMTGSIAMKGIEALYLSNYMQDAKGDEAAVALANFLTEAFKMKTTSCSVSKIESDSLTIKYTANYDGRELDADGGGLLLNEPSLFGGSTRFTTIAIEGPRYIQGFEQHDTWIIPKQYRTVNGKHIAETFANGTWTLTGNTLKRSYVQHTTTLAPSDSSSPNSFWREHDEFASTEIWTR